MARDMTELSRERRRGEAETERRPMFQFLARRLAERPFKKFNELFNYYYLVLITFKVFVKYCSELAR